MGLSLKGSLAQRRSLWEVSQQGSLGKGASRYLLCALSTAISRRFLGRLSQRGSLRRLMWEGLYQQGLTASERLSLRGHPSEALPEVLSGVHSQMLSQRGSARHCPKGDMRCSLWGYLGCSLWSSLRAPWQRHCERCLVQRLGVRGTLIEREALREKLLVERRCVRGSQREAPRVRCCVRSSLRDALRERDEAACKDLPECGSA